MGSFSSLLSLWRSQQVTQSVDARPGKVGGRNFGLYEKQVVNTYLIFVSYRNKWQTKCNVP